MPRPARPHLASVPIHHEDYEGVIGAGNGVAPSRRKTSDDERNTDDQRGDDPVGHAPSLTLAFAECCQPVPKKALVPFIVGNKMRGAVHVGSIAFSLTWAHFPKHIIFLVYPDDLVFALLRSVIRHDTFFPVNVAPLPLDACA